MKSCRRIWTIFAILTALALVVIVPLSAAVFAPTTLKKLAAHTIIDKMLPPLLPVLQVQRSAHWLDQGWSNRDRFWFHHASQGTATFPVPYDWFIALEQPGLALSRGLIKDRDYLARFGFIASPRTLNANPEAIARYGFSGERGQETPAGLLARTPTENADGLPVGFARTVGGTDSGSGKQQPDQLGLTCAACHTGHLEYRGTSLRFDGGPAMIDLQKLTEAIGLSIAYTVKLPWRFDAFADRVLGEQAADSKKRDKLKVDLSKVLRGAFNQIEIHEAVIKPELQRRNQDEETEEGFGRLDALNRIGNQVFYTDMADANGNGSQQNIAALLAPVSFPPIWTVPWFTWAQYDASIGQPLVRNAGEALGVMAIINLASPDNKFMKLYTSSVSTNNLYTIESLLRGTDPFAAEPHAFHGLRAPKWPEAYFPDDANWKLDATRIARGRGLYRELCVGCHLGPVNDPDFDKAYPDKSLWTAPQWRQIGNEKFLQTVQLPVDDVGTDPEQSKVLKDRLVEVASLHLDPIQDLKAKWSCENVDTAAADKLPYSLALMIVVDKTNERWFADHNVSSNDQKKIVGPRQNCPNSRSGYKARPLDGVWATAPYLHNGSVPSLWWLLKPAASRPTSFCLGARDFNPKVVGYDVPDGGAKSCADGQTLFAAFSATGKPVIGNSTMGHSFEGEGGKRMPGIVGRALSDDERYDLIEYLKTL